MNVARQSTTHEETFHHVVIPNGAFGAGTKIGTVFMRKEQDGWYAAASVKSKNDVFCRKIGRNISRRRYFQQPGFRALVKDASYESAFIIYELTSNLMFKDLA